MILSTNLNIYKILKYVLNWNFFTLKILFWDKIQGSSDIVHIGLHNPFIFFVFQNNVQPSFYFFIFYITSIVVGGYDFKTVIA